MPTQLKISHEMIASTNGNAMRDMVGNWITGMIPKMLFTRMKTNSVVRYGTNLRTPGR